MVGPWILQSGAILSQSGYIPIYEPTLGSLEKKYLLDAFASRRISGFGPHIQEFEQRFAEYVGRGFAISTFNGTVALSLALAALDIGKNRKVLTADYTYVATANSVIHAGAEPVFFDADESNIQPSPNEAAAKIDSSQSAVLFPHLYGYPSNLDPLTARAEELGIPVIEDCSEILGSSRGGMPGGNSGLLSTYSFFGNKTITTGEGGMVVTDDPILAERMRLLRNQGATPGPDYFFSEVGFNFRMTNIQAAIGIAQLLQIEKFLEKKADIFEQYRTALSSSLFLLGSPPGGVSSFWLVAVLIPEGANRAQLIDTARSYGVDLRPGFIPMHQLPLYSGSGTQFPGASAFAERVVLLPSYPNLSRKSVKRVVQAVLDGLKRWL
jgi:perosamine synthetase